MTAFPLHPVAVRGIKATEYRHQKKSSLMNVLVKVLNMPAKSTAVPGRKDEKAADPLSIKMSVESPMHPRFLQQLQKGGTRRWGQKANPQGQCCTPAWTMGILKGHRLILHRNTNAIDLLEERTPRRCLTEDPACVTASRICHM